MSTPTQHPGAAPAQGRRTGWTTIPERTKALALPRPRPDGGYELKIGRLVDDYPDFTISAGFEAFGWRARMRSADGRGHVGRELAGLVLDDLADKMDAARDAVIDVAALPRREPGASGQGSGRPVTAGGYTEAQLLADFGQAWVIWWRDYLDGRQLVAVPRGALDFIPLARPTPAAMRDCLASQPARPG